MKIQGYEVICYGVRQAGYKGHRPLCKVCKDCGLYVQSTMHPVKPAWRAFGFIKLGKHTCKVKELWKEERMTSKMES